jgi:ribose 5-phosphate isomerase B
LAYSPEIAKIGRSHNDANVICFGARTMKIEDVLQSLDVFFTEPFIGGKYQRRNEKVDAQC